MLALAVSKKANIAYVAPTYGHARDIAWAILKERAEPLYPNINQSRLSIEVPNREGTTSLISLRGWESIDNMLGQAFDLIVLDEVALYKDFFYYWNKVLRPTLADRKGGALFISTPKGFNHFYELYNYSLTKPEWESFQFTTYDNPHIDKQEIEQAKQDLPEEVFAQEYLADFRKQAGLIYKEFDRGLHLFSDIQGIKLKEKIAGLDFGFNNPTALVEIWVDTDNHFWIVSEYYQKERTHEQIGDYVSSLPLNRVYPDPASPEAIQVLKNKKVNVYDVVKGHDSVNAGIQKVRELLKQRRLHIHESCSNTIWEFETYAYNFDARTDDAKEKPMKENDHAMDALRYAIMTYSPASRTNDWEREMKRAERRDRKRNATGL